MIYNEFVENEMAYRYYIDRYFHVCQAKDCAETQEILSEMDSLSKDYTYILEKRKGHATVEKLRRIQR